MLLTFLNCWRAVHESVSMKNGKESSYRAFDAIFGQASTQQRFDSIPAFLSRWRAAYLERIVVVSR